MYHEYTQEQLRAYSRTYIETLETWARQLIHEKMTVKYGDNYIFSQLKDGNYLVRKEIRNHVSRMLSGEPSRFNRQIDTLFFEHIVYFLCNEQWYNDLFKEPLGYAYPQGAREARVFLERLILIRNPLSHSNPITMHDVERAICYSHDFIESLKKYYKERGEEQMWNVPRIIKIKDSLGNIFDNFTDTHGIYSIFVVNNQLHCGEEYSVEIEVDSSFSKDQYDIIWVDNGGRENSLFKNSEKYTIRFTMKDIAQLHIIQCKIIQKKEWHKYTYHDCQVLLNLTVLPPIE